jgi:hypothetical protein
MMYMSRRVWLVQAVRQRTMHNGRQVCVSAVLLLCKPIRGWTRAASIWATFGAVPSNAMSPRANITMATSASFVTRSPRMMGSGSRFIACEDQHTPYDHDTAKPRRQARPCTYVPASTPDASCAECVTRRAPTVSNGGVAAAAGVSVDAGGGPERGGNRLALASETASPIAEGGCWG